MAHTVDPRTVDPRLSDIDPAPTAARWQAMRPAERTRWFRSRYRKPEAEEVPRRGLDLIDLALLCELPLTPPEEKDRYLRELHARLQRGRAAGPARVDR